MTISDRACLVTLAIKSPGFRKTSKRGSAELASANDAENDRVAASVALLPRECLSALGKATSAARKLFMGASAAWSDAGRMIPIPKIGDVRAKYAPIKDAHERAKNELGARYADLIRDAKPALGNFAADFVFPSWDQVAAKISMELNFLPLPGSESDWRLKLQQEELDVMKAGIEAANAEMQANNRERAQEALNDMLARVGAYKIVHDDTTKSGERIEGAFHQSALDNLRETAEMLRSLNFLNDAGFADICDEMERIGKLKANELKASKAYRHRVLASAGALVERLA